MMKQTPDYIRYELLPEYSERSQLTDLFLDHKILGWIGLLIIFILISLVIFFQLKIWDSEDRIANKKFNDWRETALKEKK